MAIAMLFSGRILFSSGHAFQLSEITRAQLTLLDVRQSETAFPEF